MLEYHPTQAGIVEDEFSTVVAFSIREPPLILDFQMAPPFDQQDYNLGMDTVYVGRADLGIGHYNAILMADILHGNILVVQLRPDVAKDMMTAANFLIPFGHLPNNAEIKTSMSKILRQTPQTTS